MRVMLMAVALLLPVGAGAQTSQTGIASPSSTAQLYQNDVASFRGFGYQQQDSSNAALRRVGAWGRCVVAADREGTRAFLSTRGVAYSRAEWRMKPVFYNCARDVGTPSFFTQGRFRTAALVDAINATRQSS